MATLLQYQQNPIQPQNKFPNALPDTLVSATGPVGPTTYNNPIELVPGVAFTVTLPPPPSVPIGTFFKFFNNAAIPNANPITIACGANAATGAVSIIGNGTNPILTTALSGTNGQLIWGNTAGTQDIPAFTTVKAINDGTKWNFTTTGFGAAAPQANTSSGFVSS